MRYTYRFIVSRKTKRHLDKLAKRRSSTDSTTDSETTTGSYSSDSIDCEDSLDDISSRSGSPLLLNEEMPTPLTCCDTLCENFIDINSLERRQLERGTMDEISKLSMDEYGWPSPHEIFMGIEEVQVITEEHLDDEKFISESINSYFDQTDSIFETANPDDIFLSG